MGGGGGGGVTGGIYWDILKIMLDSGIFWLIF